MKEYTVSVPGGIDLTLLLDEDEAKARGALPVQAPKAAADPAPEQTPEPAPVARPDEPGEGDNRPDAKPDALPTKTVAPANKARAGQAKA